MFEDFWYDFGSRQGGDVIDLCAETECKGNRGKAIDYLARLTGVDCTDGGVWRETIQNQCHMIALWHTKLREQDRNYLHSRGITDKTINELRIGFDSDRIWIPYYKNDYVYNWVGRTTISAEPNTKNAVKNLDTTTRHRGYDTLGRDSDDLYICEGTFDALVAWQAGVPVLATMGGAFPKATLGTVKDIARRFERVILTFDMDKEGQESR